MPLVHMDDMLRHAYQHQYAVPAFDVVSLDFITGILNAAESKQAPVIISLAESHFEYFDFELLMAAVEKAAQRTSAPVAIHLDHGESFESAVRGINLGCTGVMVDASSLPLEGNIEQTRRVAEMAHGCGIPVEGELGYVPGVEGEDAERHPGEVVYTTVEEAKRYVEATGVDMLAVSIGTVHGRMKGEPRLDFDRLAEINQALQLPLVIHGGTGLSDEQFRRLIENGVTKINYYTALADAAGGCINRNLETEGAAGYTSLVRGVPAAIQQEAERCIELWGSASRANDLLESCRPTKPVDHVIVYNTEGLDEDQVDDMMAEGRRVLSAIPGVRDVFIGHAIQDDAGYKHCWVVRFSGVKVRRLDDLVAVTGEVSPPHIIDEEDDDIRLLRRGDAKKDEKCEDDGGDLHPDNLPELRTPNKRFLGSGASPAAVRYRALRIFHIAVRARAEPRPSVVAVDRDTIAPVSPPPHETGLRHPERNGCSR